jgi:hypothetical protein
VFVLGLRSAAELQQLAVDGATVAVLLEALGQLPPPQPVLGLLAFQLAAQHRQTV